MSKGAIFIYRNCFTGDVSGGDMHTGGVAEWLCDNQPQYDTYLVHADNDGQAKAYHETAKLHELTYRGTNIGTPAVMFPLRAQKAAHMHLPLHPASNIFVAGSHFLPDILPIVHQAKRAPGAEKIVYIHHIVQDMPRAASLNTTLANLQERFCFSLIKKHFDKIIVVNQEVARALKERGFTQPILCTGNFVNTHAATPIDYSHKDITLAFCGRLVRQKGIDDFVAVCESLAVNVPGFAAVMVGAGPEQHRLEGLVQAKKLPIRITGFVPDNEKFGLLARSKLFVFPSIEEGWGIAIAESLSVGTPVLAFDLPVYQGPFGGYLQTVPLKKSGKLGDAAQSLLANWNTHPDSYAKLQQKLIRRAANFSRDHIAKTEFTFMTEDDHEEPEQP